MAILPLLAMWFMVLKGFVYTIAVDVYAFRCVFSGKLHRILQHFALRLAPKRTPFSGKQLRNRCKWQSFQIKIHFANIHMLPLFAPKQTFARIDFLRQGGRLVNRKGTHNVKKHA